MSSLALNEENFNSERDVVKEEYRQRILANPYGEFFLDSIKNSYAVHPYKRPESAISRSLRLRHLAEVRAFHSTFYRPDNATLVVVGDFQPDELHDWVNKYFGAIKKPLGKIPRGPQRAAAQRRQADRQYSPKAPLPAIAVTYLGPSVRGEDVPALVLGAEILAGGESSRLYQSLVYGSKSHSRRASVPTFTKSSGCLLADSFWRAENPRPGGGSAERRDLYRFCGKA